MKERLFYNIPEGQDKKIIVEALKNEFKYNKKIPILNSNYEAIAYTSKYEVYTNYIDFYLNDPIADHTMKQLGKIQSIDIYVDENIKKDKKEKRIDSILA